MASATSDDGVKDDGVEDRNSVRSAPLPRVVEGERVVVEDVSSDLPEHVYDDLRSRSQFSSGYRRRRRPRVTRSEADHENPREEPERSLPDRITRTALSGTLGVLRQVGGITLSTTGALVAPPLHVTKTILLPQLWAAFVDFLSSSSPPRVKDWFRIVQTSVYHVVNTLLHTSAGTKARQQWLIVWNDWMDIIASEPTRQWIVDAASTLIQTAEVLESSDASGVLDQLTITLCRGIDVVASARTKLLVHDGRHAVASLAALWADPATTTALAEVTAYICHALEMEDGKRNSDMNRRRRRQQYTAATMERETLGQRPGMTVEEAILSSLEPGRYGVDDDDQSYCEPQSWDQASSSIRQQLDGTDQNKDDNKEEDFAVQAREDVDVEYLRDAMEERAMRARAKKHEKQEQQSKELYDLEHVPIDENDGPKASRTRQRVVKPVDDDEDVDCDDEGLDIPITLRSRHPGRLEGESSLEQFDRVVNEILSQKRQESPPPREARGSVRRPGKEFLDGWIKKAQELSRSEQRKQASRGSTTVLLVGGTVVATIGLMWFAFGCYGLYHLTRPQSQKLGAGSTILGAGNEIVIRVVKEIVHTTTDGEVLSRSSRDLQSESEMNSKIVECVASLYK